MGVLNIDTIYYNANNLKYKFVQEEDGWWSIYRWHRYKLDYVPLLQSKDLEHCKEYADLCEPINVPLEKLC